MRPRVRRWPAPPIAGASRARAWRRLSGMVLLLIAHVPLHYLWRAVRLRDRPGRASSSAGRRAAGADVRIVGMPLTRDVLYRRQPYFLDRYPDHRRRHAARASCPRRRWGAGRSSAGSPALNRTIYVIATERGRVQEQTEALREAIGDRQPVTLFPEGGTTDGRALLPVPRLAAGGDRAAATGRDGCSRW